MMMATGRKKIRARKRLGLAGAPLNGTFRQFKQYIQTEVDNRELVDIVKNYVKREFTKGESIAILANPGYKLYMPGFASMCYWEALGNKFDDTYIHAKEYMTDKFEELYDSGYEIVNKNKVNKKIEETKFVITPAMKSRNVVLTTIIQELYDIEKCWLLGEATPKYNLYNQMTIHNVRVFADIEEWIHEYLDDYLLFLNRDPDILVAYSHISLPKIKERISFLQGLLDDVELFKNSRKAVRTIRVKKPKAADKQVERLNYQNNNAEYKLISINPMHIPGSMNVYVFNTKTRQLTQFVSDTPDGLQVSGSTIKKFNKEYSMVVTLRKPMEILPKILKLTHKQITKLINTIKTKKRIPTGRINKDMIILRCK